MKSTPSGIFYRGLIVSLTLRLLLSFFPDLGVSRSGQGLILFLTLRLLSEKAGKTKSPSFRGQILRVSLQAGRDNCGALSLWSEIELRLAFPLCTSCFS